MSADNIGECPVCGTSNFAEYYEFYIRGNVLTADYSAECKKTWDGCGFTLSMKADKEFELPARPILEPTEITHRCPPQGQSLTPCCGKSPFELLRTDRMSLHDDLVNCGK